MVTYKKAGPGKKWVLTELGLEQGYVRAKYEVSNSNRKQYEQVVPQSWVSKGYVKLKEDK